MAAYSSCVNIKSTIEIIIKYFNVFLPAPVMEIIQGVYRKLKSFQEFAERLDSRSRKRMGGSLARAAEAIREFYDVFESHFDELWDGELSKLNHGDRFSVVLGGLKRHTDSFIEMLKKTKEEEYGYCYPEDEEADSSSAGNKMVGLRDQYTEVKGFVLSNYDCILHLVGMTGIGKTTFARNFFQDLDVVELFECRAWVTVGNEFKPEEILESVIAQVDPLYTMGTAGNKEKMEKYLQNVLKHKSTLIVLDDAWDSSINQLFGGLFTRFNKYFRVLVTTRSYYVVKDCNYNADPLVVRLLNKDKSWDLLRVKVFDQESCPPQLVDAGKKIAEKCDGLPLTIVRVADLLSKAGKTLESLWIELATQKKHQLFTEAYDEISKVLYPSYESLHLEEYKPSYLYMGVFPLKYKIPRSQLTNMWIAEGQFAHMRMHFMKIML